MQQCTVLCTYKREEKDEKDDKEKQEFCGTEWQSRCKVGTGNGNSGPAQWTGTAMGPFLNLMQI